MGLKKNDSTATAPVQSAPVVAPVATAPATIAAPESGTSAAIDRLKKSSTVGVAKAETKVQGRDYAEEARGKTRCVQFEAALMSPAIAGMKFDTMDEYLALCKKAADFGTAYTFGD